MDEPSAEEIAARLTPEQGVIVLGTPESWREADALPDGLFDFDETYDPETAAETRFWVPTELGKQVQEIARAEPLKS